MYKQRVQDKFKTEKKTVLSGTTTKCKNFIYLPIYYRDFNDYRGILQGEERNHAKVQVWATVSFKSTYQFSKRKRLPVFIKKTKEELIAAWDKNASHHIEESPQPRLTLDRIRQNEFKAQLDKIRVEHHSRLKSHFENSQDSKSNTSISNSMCQSVKMARKGTIKVPGDSSQHTDSKVRLPKQNGQSRAKA